MTAFEEWYPQEGLVISIALKARILKAAPWRLIQLFSGSKRTKRQLKAHGPLDCKASRPRNQKTLVLTAD